MPPTRHVAPRSARSACRRPRRWPLMRVPRMGPPRPRPRPKAFRQTQRAPQPSQGLNHSWLCKGLEVRSSEELGVWPNQRGLITELCDARRCCQGLAEDRAGQSGARDCRGACSGTGPSNKDVGRRSGGAEVAGRSSPVPVDCADTRRLQQSTSASTASSHRRTHSAASRLWSSPVRQQTTSRTTARSPRPGRGKLRLSTGVPTQRILLGWQ